MVTHQESPVKRLGEKTGCPEFLTGAPLGGYPTSFRNSSMWRGTAFRASSLPSYSSAT